MLTFVDPRVDNDVSYLLSYPSRNGERLWEPPVIRSLDWRNANSEIARFSLDRPRRAYVEAVMAQRRGAERLDHNACNGCYHDEGPFATCITVVDLQGKNLFGGACAISTLTAKTAPIVSPPCSYSKRADY